MPIRRLNPRQRLRLFIASALVGAALVAIAFWIRQSPSHQRVWVPEQAHLPQVSVDGSRVEIRHVRNFRYLANGETQADFETRVYDLESLERVWFVVSTFTNWRGPAHAFLTFGFADGQFLSISVEARREVGEEYSTWKGALRKFELMLVMGDEEDLIALRTNRWQDPVYLYPIQAPPETVRGIFMRLLDRAQQIERQPEHYHTLLSNCASNLRDAVNAVTPRRLPWSFSVALPGYADRLIHRLSLIDTDLPLAEARERFRINEKALAEGPEFSRRIRQ
jgi:hypothetical protein